MCWILHVLELADEDVQEITGMDCFGGDLEIQRI